MLFITCFVDDCKKNDYYNWMKPNPPPPTNAQRLQKVKQVNMMDYMTAQFYEKMDLA